MKNIEQEIYDNRDKSLDDALKFYLVYEIATHTVKLVCRDQSMTLPCYEEGFNKYSNILRALTKITMPHSIKKP